MATTTDTFNGAYVIPAKTFDGSVAGGTGPIPGVTFGGANKIQSISAESWAPAAAVYGNSDWSLEVWYKMNGNEIGGELPLFQW